ncbi:deoxyribose-phosphate aldolase [Staphylococcus pettenkoferi]|mgnify:FL=1|uniref:deoxyribose-phosphate aldolase n=1 Tax=Staphylococcus pettenkoferi TaxID=170573 RepID=UPI002273B2BD|nr:deoxyribose-phosphate aldolase [Staphylococcus pettenkoferi]MCY1593109.1 deoxyribose-phosphate aldolase [Staphylococcus pettenkoferi]MCY1606889.1 deoxyribose-phosphate aldolase [Staphylococcus pettenkoferi]MCY1611516.1 deoxyribose-phosphate aldolase [Staphylococcus pettenkoferi]MCY1624896.1 deoxyribose-phosphate aldolase [Staphylococcus pettenkoferi]MDH9616709.1 deoxyribose-phosphate aldolase [Staphylococcus pettenkoferi]
MSYAKYIDHTLLKPDATTQQIDQLINEAKAYQFKSICIHPGHVRHAAEKLGDSDVLICTVIGFPLGATSTETKVFETEDAIKNGAQEIDMVLNIGALKEQDYERVEADIFAVVQAANHKTVKVIIETCLLTDEEKVKACELSQSAGADFVKTSTGFAGGGATTHDVQLMKQTVGQAMEVKASGGVRTADDFLQMLEAGATRVGASAGVAIIDALE